MQAPTCRYVCWLQFMAKTLFAESLASILEEYQAQKLRFLRPLRLSSSNLLVLLYLLISHYWKVHTACSIKTCTVQPLMYIFSHHRQLRKI